MTYCWPFINISYDEFSPQTLPPNRASQTIILSCTHHVKSIDIIIRYIVLTVNIDTYCTSVYLNSISCSIDIQYYTYHVYSYYYVDLCNVTPRHNLKTVDDIEIFLAPLLM